MGRAGMGGSCRRGGDRLGFGDRWIVMMDVNTNMDTLSGAILTGFALCGTGWVAGGDRANGLGPQAVAKVAAT